MSFVAVEEGKGLRQLPGLGALLKPGKLGGTGPWLYLGGVFKMFLMVALQTYQNDSW